MPGTVSRVISDGQLEIFLEAIEEIRHREEEFRQFETNVLQHWPSFSKQAVTEARMEDERGKSLDLDEVFAKSAGVDRDSWIKLVANHKSKSASGRANSPH